MSAYESLAACYDELTYDIRYEKTLTFFERLCAREHVQPHSVLDLACGTGSLSMLLAGRGYRVIGADLSAEMLAEAERKARELPEENRPFLICQPASAGGAGRRGHLRAGQSQLSLASGRLPENVPARI